MVMTFSRQSNCQTSLDGQYSDHQTLCPRRRRAPAQPSTQVQTLRISNDLSTGSKATFTVRDATIDLLRRFGMTSVFGNPGSTELPMFRDFPEDFRYVLGLQESVVVAMADGFAQSRGTAAFVNLHSAIGVGHAVGSLFTAYRNQTPLLITAVPQDR